MSPSRINGECLVFATTVNSGVIHVDNILTLLSVRFFNELLHLLDGKVYGNHFCNAEECRLQDCVCAVAQTYLLSYLSGIDVIHIDVVFRKIFLDVVWQVSDKFFSVPDGVKQESTAIAQTAQHVIHVKVCLHVASHKIWGLYLIGGTNGSVTKAQM